jgi:hypothetical protein
MLRRHAFLQNGFRFILNQYQVNNHQHLHNHSGIYFVCFLWRGRTQCSSESRDPAMPVPSCLVRPTPNHRFECSLEFEPPWHLSVCTFRYTLFYNNFGFGVTKGHRVRNATLRIILVTCRDVHHRQVSCAKLGYSANEKSDGGANRSKYG